MATSEEGKVTALLAKLMDSMQSQLQELTLKQRDTDNASKYIQATLDSISEKVNSIDAMLRVSNGNPSMLERLRSLEGYVESAKERQKSLIKDRDAFKKFIAEQWFKLVIALTTSGGVIYAILNHLLGNSGD